MKERGYSLGNLDATIIAEVHFPQKYFCHKAFVISVHVRPAIRWATWTPPPSPRYECQRPQHSV